MGFVETVFVVCMILALVGAGPWVAERYRSYSGLPMWIAVACLGLKAFGH